MVKDIYRLIFQFAVIALLFALLNMYLYNASPFFLKQKAYQRQIEGYFDRQAKNLIIGDSHAAVLSNDMLNPDTYNISSGGDSFKESFIKLRYILKQTNAVRNIMLTMDAQMFSARRSQSSNNKFLNRNVFYLGSYDVYGYGFLSVVSDMVPLFNNSYIDYLNRNLQNIISGKKSKVHVNQILRKDQTLWGTVCTPEKRRERAIETGRGDHQQVFDDQTHAEYYQKIVNLSHAHRINIIGVKFPAMLEYCEQLPDDNRIRIEAFFESISFKQVLDYRNLTQNPKLYTNEDHLNKMGADLLLRQIEIDTGLKLAN